MLDQATQDTLREIVAADYVNHVIFVLERLIKEYEPRALRDLSSSWGRDGYAYRAYSRFLARTDRGVVTGINHEWLGKESRKYAAAQVESFIHKLKIKLTGVTDIRVGMFNPERMSFVVTGALGAEDEVELIQSRIINTSVKGLAYHQWPALIYLNGKRMPESTFKKLPR